MTDSPRTAAALYTPEMLALAVQLADCPWQADHPLHGEARSRTCGGTVAMSLALQGEQVNALGIRVSACAVGQAAAAIFASSATGRSADELRRAAGEIEAWLAGSKDEPAWPNLSTLAPALPHQGRHQAILLPWQAALSAMGKRGASD